MTASKSSISIHYECYVLRNGPLSQRAENDIFASSTGPFCDEFDRRGCPYPSSNTASHDRNEDELMIGMMLIAVGSWSIADCMLSTQHAWDRYPYSRIRDLMEGYNTQRSKLASSFRK